VDEFFVIRDERFDFGDFPLLDGVMKVIAKKHNNKEEQNKNDQNNDCFKVHGSSSFQNDFRKNSLFPT